jgi:endonuclease/exonuclease/phosphatase (EEP) superfamily protein YafD
LFIDFLHRLRFAKTPLRRSLQPFIHMPAPTQILAALLWFFRAAVKVFSLMAAVLLVTTTLALHWGGQHNVTTAFLLYLPAWLWALPLAVLLPLLLFVSRRGALVAAVMLTAYWGWWLDYGWVGPQDLNAPSDVRLLTWNRGQSGGQSLQPLKQRVRPDIIALQDAHRRMSSYTAAPEYADLPHMAQEAEFLVMSRFPILRSESIAFPSAPDAVPEKNVIIAGRFEVDGPAGVFVLYSVHFPTPRDTLSHHARGAFLLGLLGVPGTEWGRKRVEYQRYWDMHLFLARQLRQRIAAETLPTLVAGDFNSPAMGPVHRQFASLLQDSHMEKGTGYGYTFPGTTRNPLAFFRAWLRLDWVLASRHWETLAQETESGRASQHLAVFAAYRMRPRS